MLNNSHNLAFAPSKSFHNIINVTPMKNTCNISCNKQPPGLLLLTKAHTKRHLMDNFHYTV